jgi:hypothetical protein
MASERQNMSEQEISIKEREHELYVKPLDAETPKSVKPFPVYLRETPAEPLSPTTKAILWMVGIIVTMLFLAALWKVSHPRGIKVRTDIAHPAAKTAMLWPSVDSPTRRQGRGASRPEPPVLAGVIL